MWAVVVAKVLMHMQTANHVYSCDLVGANWGIMWPLAGRDGVGGEVALDVELKLRRIFHNRLSLVHPSCLDVGQTLPPTTPRDWVADYVLISAESTGGAGQANSLSNQKQNQPLHKTQEKM